MVLAWILATPVRDFDWGRPKFTFAVGSLSLQFQSFFKTALAAHSPQQITPNTAIWQTLQLCSKGGRIGQSKFASCQFTDHFEIMPATAKPATSTTSTAGIGAGRWSGSMSVDLEVPEMGSSSGSRSSFEIHTSGAKPETSTAIVCTGPHFFKSFHDSKSGTSKLCPGLPNRLPAPPARPVRRNRSAISAARSFRSDSEEL